MGFSSIFLCLLISLLLNYSVGDFSDNVVRRNSVHPKKLNRSYGGPFRQMFRSNADLNIHPTDKGDPGEPAFLTPLLEAGKVKEALTLSRVRIGHRYGHSFAGFITVNKNYGSNLYFWFCPATAKPPSAPVLVWLQGGPGGSSLFGLFEEIGPFSVDGDMLLVPRNYSWNKNHSVIFIDNPVGTGFSFTENDAGYASNEADVGRDLYEFMKQFYMLFPDLLKNPLYLTGESYAGKYIPALAYTIHEMNKESETKMNLRGVAIGDGFCDPLSMLNYGDFLYQIGLIDELQKIVFDTEISKGLQYIRQQQWEKAFEVFDNVLNGDLTGRPSLFTNMTGLTSYYSFVDNPDPPETFSYWMKFINRAVVRAEINVGNLTFHSGLKVEEMMKQDMMQSVKPWIETLANEDYRILFYNGQLDIIVAYAMTDNFIKTLNWKNADMFKKSERMIWKVDGKVAGYVRQVPNFAQVLVRNAGHMVPMDQPRVAADLIERFVGE